MLSREDRREARSWFWYGLRWVAAIFAVFVVFGFATQGTEFFMYKFWAPKQENVRREVFENTKSYKQGVAQDLYKTQEEYIKADSSEKCTLATVILHRYADVNEDNLPVDLRNFLSELRAKRRTCL